MTTPGITFLGRTVPLAGSLSLGVFSLLRFVTKSGFSFPPWTLLVGSSISLPIGFALRVLYVGIARRRQAARMGARLAPCVKGKRFGNLDVMFNLVQQVRNGYVGMSITPPP